jgi:hypothetical protein
VEGLTPFCLAAALGANLALLSETTLVYVLAAQLGFYGTAALGYGLRRLSLPAGPLRLPAYFVTINAALGLGMLRGLLGRQSAAWARTARQPVAGGRD